MKQKIVKFIRHQPRWRLALAVVLVGCIFIFALRDAEKVDDQITYTVKRGDLSITVLEGGSIEAMESQEVRSEVRSPGGLKILKIVEEGSVITEDDVKNGKVLVELDSADLRDRIVQQEINYQSALANLTDASQNYEIQRNQNTSNIKAAEDKALFARMDLEKFLGDKSAKEIIKTLKLDLVEDAAKKMFSGEDAESQMISAMEKTDIHERNDNAAGLSTNTAPKGPTVELISAPSVAKMADGAPVIDFSTYANPESLGDGSAMQDLRRTMDDLQSAKQQFGLAETKLAGTKRLFEKGFATKTELETDQISYDNNQLKVKTAETAYNLFIKYEFIKQCRDLISRFQESLRALEREKKESISKLAQARARLKGAEGRFNIEVNQRRDLLDQLEKCVIKAQRPGLVVYGGSESDRFDSSEQIREGATVRERQPIITIPNMSRMSVRVKVHESYIQKVSKGLKAKIKVDAFPNETLIGEVIKVGILPDSQNRWLNPDMKVYQTSVGINATNDWLKPGMSAKVELMVKELNDVICVPIQAVSESNGKRYCQVVNGRVEKREVTTGEFNDEFIEITRGLREGEKVSLRAPEAEIVSKDGGSNTDSKAKTQKPKTAEPAKEKAK